jgi:predicted nucleic acid-binding Zn ribbon protein
MMKTGDRNAGGAVPIGGVLDGLLKDLRLETERGMLRVWPVWERVVGADIARNARPAACKGSVLLVYVTSSTWLHHLHYRKRELIELLNHHLGQVVVSDIKFKVGSF